MVLDVSGIIQERLEELEASGELRDYIKQNIDKTVKEAISNVLGGYQLRKAVEEGLCQEFPEIVKEIGLGGYNTFIAETVRKICLANMEADAQEKISSAIEESVLRKRETITLSEILSEYRKHVNYNDDEEWKRDQNENEGGYTCAVRKQKKYSSTVFDYYALWFDEDGYKEDTDMDEYDLVVKLSGLYTPDKNAKTHIDEIYFHGDRISKQFIHNEPDRFEAMIMNLYLNKTEIIMDLEDYDDDDHYYEVEDY